MLTVSKLELSAVTRLNVAEGARIRIVPTAPPTEMIPEVLFKPGSPEIPASNGSAFNATGHGEPAVPAQEFVPENASYPAVEYVPMVPAFPGSGKAKLRCKANSEWDFSCSSNWLIKGKPADRPPCMEDTIEFDADSAYSMTVRPFTAVREVRLIGRGTGTIFNRLCPNVEAFVNDEVCTPKQTLVQSARPFNATGNGEDATDDVWFNTTTYGLDEFGEFMESRPGQFGAGLLELLAPGWKTSLKDEQPIIPLEFVPPVYGTPGIGGVGVGMGYEQIRCRSVIR